MTCVCGNTVEGILEALGSPWCMACRENPDRRDFFLFARRLPIVEVFGHRLIEVRAV